ncbi:MAG: ATP-binding protein [Chloroflexota bacterium]
MTIMNGAEPAELVVLRAALVRAQQEMLADNATIAVPDLEPGYVRTIASAIGNPKELWQSRFALRDGVAGEVAATRQIVVVNDVSRFPQFRRLGGRTIKSILAAPIEDGGRVRGIITVTSAKEDAFSARSIDTLANVMPLLDAALALSERAAWGTYLAGLAHDISTPVSSVRGFLQLLSGQTATMPPAQLAEYVQLASIAVDQLVHLGGDMHDVLSMSRQTLRLEFSTFDAVTMLQSTLAMLEPLAAEAGVQLRCRLRAKVQLVRGDRHRIERILSNLVQNAIKFTPAGRSIVVGLERADALTVRLLVDDEGPGIAEADLPHVFDLNYQSAITYKNAVTGRRAGRSHGHGLGLAIARTLARAHGGELSAGNRPDGGARFVLCLPVSLPVDGHDSVRLPLYTVPVTNEQPLFSDEREQFDRALATA